MLFRCIFALFLLTISTATLADAVDVNLRDDSAQFQYLASMGRDTLGKADMHAGIIYADRINLLGDIGIMVRNDLGENAPGVSVGVGFKGLMAKVQDTNAAAFALGGIVRISPLANHRFGIAGQLYYSPNIVTFGKADRYIETGVRLEYELIPQASAYIGYRKVKFGLESNADATLDEGGFVGARIMF